MKLEYRTNVCLLAMIIACIRYVLCFVPEEIDLLRNNFKVIRIKIKCRNIPSKKPRINMIMETVSSKN
jgi:hypothetical protein